MEMELLIGHFEFLLIEFLNVIEGWFLDDVYIDFIVIPYNFMNLIINIEIKMGKPIFSENFHPLQGFLMVLEQQKFK